MSFIVKHITPPRNPQSIGDKRKADSYLVEANFYENVAPVLRQLSQDADANSCQAHVPVCYHIERLPHQHVILCLSFINEERASHKVSRSLHPTVQSHDHEVLGWLAAFHASHWDIANKDTIIRDLGLQEQGSYWYLDTRPDEHDQMSHKGWEGRLKLAARAIDDRLKRDSYQCLIHGDPKDANVLVGYEDSDVGDLSSNDPSVSPPRTYLVDFQYCGKGNPAKDLAYYLCTSSSVEAGNAYDEEPLLEYYLQTLQGCLTVISKSSKSSHGVRVPSLEELQDSLDLAYCDFCRFMCGWGHWGGDLMQPVLRVLDRLDGGHCLESEEAYLAAMEHAYPIIS